MWFGDSVTIAGYSDLWLAERHAVLFSDNVYGGGALVLFALHEKIGDKT